MSLSFSARWVCRLTPCARASSAASRIRPGLTENGLQGATTTRNHVFREILTGAAPLADPPQPRPPPPFNPSGHYHHEDDALDAGDDDSFMHDANLNTASDEEPEAEHAADPGAHLPPPPPPPPPAPPEIVDLEFWTVIDAMTPEQRLAFMAARLEPQPPTARAPSPPFPPTRRRRPPPTRRNPPRAARHDGPLSDV